MLFSMREATLVADLRRFIGLRRESATGVASYSLGRPSVPIGAAKMPLLLDIWLASN
jgi:hypothetical protein